MDTHEPPEGGWTMPSLFNLNDIPVQKPSEHWFFGDAATWELPAWLPDSYDEFWLRSVGIDPL
jgi:hypothetical protein